MIKRSTACVALSLFAFSLFCFIWSCQNPNSVGKNDNKDTTKPATRVKLHLVISDSLGKAYLDTTYKINLDSIDRFHVKEMAACGEPPRKTGGSSPCTIDIEVSKDEDDDDKN